MKVFPEKTLKHFLCLSSTGYTRTVLWYPCDLVSTYQLTHSLSKVQDIFKIVFIVLLNTLRLLNMQSSIMTKPEQLPSEALQCVIQDTFQTNAAKPDRLQSYSMDQVTPLRSGYTTPLEILSPLSSGQITPIKSGQITPISSGQYTPLSADHSIPQGMGHNTHSIMPISSMQTTPLNNNSPLGRFTLSGSVSPLIIYPTSPFENGIGDVAMECESSPSPVSFLTDSLSPVSLLPCAPASSITSHTFSFTQECSSLSNIDSTDFLFSTPSLSCS